MEAPPPPPRKQPTVTARAKKIIRGVRAIPANSIHTTTSARTRRMPERSGQWMMEPFGNRVHRMQWYREMHVDHPGSVQHAISRAMINPYQKKIYMPLVPRRGPVDTHEFRDPSDLVLYRRPMLNGGPTGTVDPRWTHRGRELVAGMAIDQAYQTAVGTRGGYAGRSARPRHIGTARRGQRLGQTDPTHLVSTRRPHMPPTMPAEITEKIMSHVKRQRTE